MRWVSAISEKENLVEALDEVSADIHEAMLGDPVDLLFVFPSDHHLFDLGRVLPRLEENLGATRIVGCSANSVIASHLELERHAGLAAIAAHLPGAEVSITHISRQDLPPLDGSPSPWRELLGVDPRLRPDFVVLADPFSLDVQQLLTGIDYAWPESTVIGGLASGASGPRGNALFHGRSIERSGAVVIGLWGNARIDAIVAQGCRPIGKPGRVTECDGHLLTGIDNQSPTRFLNELYGTLDEKTRELAQRALHVGVVVDELREEIGPRDFLIRNILGMHEEAGVVAVGSDLRPGQTLQFHVRDQQTASEDLHRQLLRYLGRHPGDEVAGALQFSCLGRGHQFAGSTNHDVGMIQEALGPLPLAGFFCNGEIGPVGPTTHLHGYTTVLGLIRPRSG